MIADTDVQLALRARLVTVPALPGSRAWENAQFEPIAGVAFIAEEYVPGPRTQRTVGPGGLIEFRPMYVVTVHWPANTKLAARKSADAVLLHFPPRLKLALPTPTDRLEVRADAAPYARPMQPSAPGFVTVPVVIPLRVATKNII